MTAVVLAGDRRGDDPLLRAAGVSCKALVPVLGRAMILRVIEALRNAPSIGEILICGPTREQVEGHSELSRFIQSRDVRWIPPKDSPCQSLLAAFRVLPDSASVIVTTADHALLDASIVEQFCAAAGKETVDVAVGVARHAAIVDAFGGMKRTPIKLRDDSWCGCNLFGFLTPSARRAVEFWRKVEIERKHPVRVARLLGWTMLIAYLTRQLTLEGALRRLGGRLQLEASAILLDRPEAGVDVDSISDWKFVEAHLHRLESQSISEDGGGR